MSENNEEIMKELKEIKEMLVLNERTNLEIINILKEMKEKEENKKQIVEYDDSEFDFDPFYFDVVDFVVEQRIITVSLIQRRFKLGYSRACRLVDTMEENKIVGPVKGTNGRDILVTKEEWEKIKKEKYNK